MAEPRVLEILVCVRPPLRVRHSSGFLQPAMGRATNKDAGLKRAASSYGAFCAHAAAHGVSTTSLKRVRCKTICRDFKYLQVKWILWSCHELKL